MATERVQGQPGKLGKTVLGKKKKKKREAGEMAQQIELLVSRLDDLILIPESHMVEGTDFSKLSCGLHMGTIGLVPAKEINQ